MKIFNSNIRTRLDPASYSESHYKYLDESGRPEAQKVRDLLQSWYDNYPNHEKRDMKCRLQSNIDIQFISAVFELYYYNLLEKLNYTLETHPNNPSGKHTKPDFKVTNDKGELFYLELTTISDKSEKEIAAESRENVVYDSISKINSPNFFVSMLISGSPSSPVPSRKLRRDLENWLNGLDPDIVQKQCDMEERNDLLTFLFKYEDWEIEFLAMPKTPEGRGKSGIRPIGMQSFGAIYDETWKQIRDSIIKKGNHYGKMKYPLLIAVNVLSPYLDDIDIVEALFGKETLIGDFNSESEKDQELNSVWCDSFGPRYKRISTVLISRDIDPWTVSKRNVCLYHNPWATYPYKGNLCKFPQAIIEGGEIKFKDGIHPKEIFNLPTNWPE